MFNTYWLVCLTWQHKNVKNAVTDSTNMTAKIVIAIAIMMINKNVSSMGLKISNTKTILRKIGNSTYMLIPAELSGRIGLDIDTDYALEIDIDSSSVNFKLVVK